MITVKASEIRDAITRAHAVSTEWQAEYIEILRLPQVYAEWQARNSRRSTPAIEFHPGRQIEDDSREANAARCRAHTWDQYAGYTLTFKYSRWNSVRADCYGHSPAVCWDGIRRETNHHFVEHLRSAYRRTEQHETLPDPFTTQLLGNFHYEDDLTEVAHDHAG